MGSSLQQVWCRVWDFLFILFISEEEKVPRTVRLWCNNVVFGKGANIYLAIFFYKTVSLELKWRLVQPWFLFPSPKLTFGIMNSAWVAAELQGQTENTSYHSENFQYTQKIFMQNLPHTRLFIRIKSDLVNSLIRPTTIIQSKHYHSFLNKKTKGEKTVLFKAKN